MLLDYSIMMAGHRRPMSVWRMRAMTVGPGLKMGRVEYGGWRAYCRCCQWDDWAGWTHAAAIDTAYAHIATCPKATPAVLD